MRRETRKAPGWWGAATLVLLLIMGACASGEGGDPWALQGQIAVHSSDWAFDTFRTSWNIVSSTFFDCLELDDPALKDSCEQDREPYIQAVLHTLDCSDGVGGGYDDIHIGTQVVVNDASGDIVGLGSLTSARIVDFGTVNDDGMIACVFDFEVDELPESEFYSVAIGGRDPVVYRSAELEELDWSLELFLGLPSQPPISLAEYESPEMPEGPVPDYTSTTTAAAASEETTATEATATTTVTTTSSETAARFDPSRFPPAPDPPEATGKGAGIAVDANIDCAGNDFLITFAVRNLTDGTQQVSQAGFFPGGDVGHALLYLDFGSIVGHDTPIEPGETLYHSEGFTNMDWLVPGSIVDVYADFHDDPGQLNTERQLTCP